MKKIFLSFVILFNLIITNCYAEEQEAVHNKQEEMTESEATDEGTAPTTSNSNNNSAAQQ
jgi:uncharacterized protein YcfL